METRFSTFKDTEMNKPQQITFAVEAIVKVRNYRGKRFSGITRALTEDEARALTRTTLYHSLRRAIIGLEISNIRIDKISYASDFLIEDKQLSFNNQ